MLALIVSLLAVVAPLNAQPDTPSPRHRYLLVVETSRAMQARKEGTLNAIQELLTSRLGDQFLPGDTVGVWTFNETLYTGRFPLRTWTPETRQSVADNIFGFVQSQAFEKKADFSPVSLALDRLVTASEWLTVVVVSSGEGRLEGTPFDQAINEFYRTWQEQQQKARMPFLIVMRAARGRLVSCKLNSAPWPVELPPLPPEPPPAPVAQTRPVAPRQPSAPVMAPPLILSGRKPQPDNLAVPLAPAVEPPVAEAKPTAPKTESAHPSETVPPSTGPAPPEKTVPPPQPNPVATVSPAPSTGGGTAASSTVVQATASRPQPLSPTPANLAPRVTNTMVGQATPPTQPPVKIGWIIGAGFISAATVVLVLWRRRFRPPAASSITRSMERDKE